MSIAWGVVVRAVLLSMLIGVVVTVGAVQVVPLTDQGVLLTLLGVSSLLAVGLGSGLAVRRPGVVERRSAVFGPAAFATAAVVATLLSGAPVPGAVQLLGTAAGAGLGWWLLTRRMPS